VSNVPHYLRSALSRCSYADYYSIPIFIAKDISFAIAIKISDLMHFSYAGGMSRSIHMRMNTQSMDHIVNDKLRQFSPNVSTYMTVRPRKKHTKPKTKG